MPATQPAITNNAGVIVTVGLVVNDDRVACVFPCGLDATISVFDTLCEDAVNSFQANVFPLIAPWLSSDAYISFCSAEGMVNGRVPARHSYASTTYPGAAGSGGSVASQVSALIVFYEDTNDVITGHRIAVAKNFLPGIGKNDIVGDVISPTVATLLLNLANGLQGGFGSILYPSGTWYRMLRAPKPRTPGTTIKRVFIAEARTRVKTQRRRLIPQ